MVTLSLQAPVVARLHYLARLVRLGDLSFQPSITCKMRKKSSGSFTSLCAGFVEVFCEFLEVCRDFVCHCGGFVYICGSLVCVDVLSLFVELFGVIVEVSVNLWRSVEILCVFVEVLYQTDAQLDWDLENEEASLTPCVLCHQGV